MALARWTATVQDAEGNAVPGCSIEVRSERTGALVPIYADRNGTVPLGNPFTASEATFGFHAVGDAYRVTAIKGAFQAVWRFVALGTMSETDVEQIVRLMGARFKTSADLLSDDNVVIGYAGSGAQFEVDAGDSIVPDDGRRYEVLAHDSTGYSDQTAGGVRLLFIPDVTLDRMTDIVVGDAAAWHPPWMPNANGGVGSIADPNWGPDDYITNLWEPLRLAHPEYITRELLGKDQSGTYDIWRYTLTPPNPQKTICLDGGIHGYERIGIVGLFLMIREIVENWQTNRGLANLRWSCKIVIIPILNPWGAAQSPKSRYNSRGVDLNRNADYLWSDYDPVSEGAAPGVQGTAPWSEVESQYLRDTIIANSRDLVAYYSYHDVNAPPSSFSNAVYIIYTNDLRMNGQSSNIAELAHQIVKGSTEPLSNMDIGVPTTFNWACREYGVIAASPEATTDGSGADRWTAKHMTKAVGFWGNMLIRAGFSERPGRRLAEPWASHMTWRAGNAADSNPIITTTSYAQVSAFTLEEEVHGAGLVRFSGSITGIVGGMTSGQTCRVEVIPALGVARNPLAVFSQARGDLWESINTATNGDRITVPFDAILPVSGWNFSGGDVMKLKAGVWVRLSIIIGGTTPSLEVTRFYGFMEFIPSDHQDRYRLYSATGHIADGEGAMQRVVL